MIEKIKKIYSNSKVLKASKGDFKHVNHAYIELLLTLKFKQSNKNLFIVLPNLYDAQKYYDSLSLTLGDENVLFFPTDQMLTSIMALGSPEFKNERLYTLRQLLKNDHPYVIVTTQEGILQRELSPTD
jgi:transcription-repair coupling factor (superfamily II helicase)